LTAESKQTLTKEEIKTIVTNVLKKDKNIVFAILFGSYARGDYFKFSDIDVAVYLKKCSKNTLKYELQLASELSKALKTDNLDIVILNEAPPALKYEIMVDGELLFTRDEDLYCFFYSYALREFFDFKYHLQQFFDDAIENLLRSQKDEAVG